MIEFGYERMFQPVYHHLGYDNEYHGLEVSFILIHDHTDRIESSSPFPLMKLFGRKAISEPDISRILRSEMTVNIRLSWKRSTMSSIS